MTRTTETDLALLCSQLRGMRLSYMAAALERQSEDPNADLRSADERIREIVEAEWEGRHNKKLNRLLKEARLRYPDATIDETIYDPSRKLDAELIERLAECRWIEEGKNLIITGATSAGKSQMACAFAVCAMQRLMTVRYIKATTLMDEMASARIREERQDYLSKTAKLDLLIIEDFGLMELDLDKCRDLFEVIDVREGRRSTIICSQFPVSSWFEMFADATYADACLARMVDKRNTYRLEMNGKSMRE